MINTNSIYEKIIEILDENKADYKLFSHKVALTWEEFSEVQKDAGFFGTEMKNMVLKADENFIVYITLQGNKLNFDAIQEKLGAKKIRLANPEELKENFGAQPGCAYPFGFDSKFDIYIDPNIYEEEWLLFSPILPSKTIQIKGNDLKIVFDSLENRVEEVIDFNT